MIKQWITVIAAMVCFFGTRVGFTASEDNFYKGKTIRLIVAFSAGGGYDAYSRTIGRHLSKYIPGNPAIVVENMTGAGGIIHANFMYQAKPDGLIIGNNAGGGNVGLLLRLVGTRSNRNAIGARLCVTAGGRTQVREVKAGSSYLGQQDLRVHFGLGQATRIDRLEILWPSGTSEVVADAAINQILTVVEGKGVIGRVPFVRAR